MIKAEVSVKMDKIELVQEISCVKIFLNDGKLDIVDKEENVEEDSQISD